STNTTLTLAQMQARVVLSIDLERSKEPIVLQDSGHQSTLPTQSAWAGVCLLYLALACHVPFPLQTMTMQGGLCGLLAGVGLEQSRKRVQMALQRALGIQQHILLQTRGRVYDLTVRVSGDRACIEGYTASYYLMQLAHHAALDVIDSSHRTSLEFKIRVR